MKTTYLNKLNNRGSSYIEFVIMFAVLTVMFYTIMQVFWIMNAHNLVVNTTRSALRELSVNGMATTEFKQNIENMLGTNRRLSNIRIEVNGDPNYLGKTIQYRHPITLTVSADYKVALTNNLSKMTPQIFTFKLSSTLVGSSEKFFKDQPGYDPVLGS